MCISVVVPTHFHVLLENGYWSPSRQDRCIPSVCCDYIPVLVQSPKPSPPLSTPQESPSPASSLGTMSSLAREINNGFTTASSLSYSPSGRGMGVATSGMDMGEVLSGQKLTDAMKSHFSDRVPPGLVETPYHRNKLVRDVSLQSEREGSWSNMQTHTGTHTHTHIYRHGQWYNDIV